MFENVKPKWYISIGALMITLVFVIFCGAPLQLQFGMWGLALTELAILLIALVPFFLFKWKLSDAMPLKKIRLKELLAVFLLFIAAYIAVHTINMISAYLFPEVLQIGVDMGVFFKTVPFPLSVIIMSITPGICEEVLHRGLILHTLKKVKSESLIMLIMAVLFGIFHLSPYRFLPTAFLGFILTYIMMRTRNFLLPVLYHAFNNAIAVALSYGQDVSQAYASIPVPIEAVAVWLIYSAITPFLFYAGVKLLNKEKLDGKLKYIAIASTILLCSVGAGILVLHPSDMHGAESATQVIKLTFTEEVTRETPPRVYDEIMIEKAGMYELSVSMKDKSGTVKNLLKVEDENGEIVWKTGAGSTFIMDTSMDLKAGVYKAIFTYETQTEQMVPVDIRFGIKKTTLGR